MKQSYVVVCGETREWETGRITFHEAVASINKLRRQFPRSTYLLIEIILDEDQDMAPQDLTKKEDLSLTPP